MPRWGQLSRMAKMLPSSFAPQHQWDPKEHGGAHLSSPEAAATHGRIPVVVDEGRVWAKQIARRKNGRSPSRCCIRCHVRENLHLL